MCAEIRMGNKPNNRIPKPMNAQSEIIVQSFRKYRLTISKMVGEEGCSYAINRQTNKLKNKIRKKREKQKLRNIFTIVANKN